MSVVVFAGPLEAPAELSVSDMESTSVTVNWHPVPRSSIMGELKEYKVMVTAIWQVTWLDIFVCLFTGVGLVWFLFDDAYHLAYQLRSSTQRTAETQTAFQIQLSGLH